MLTLKSQFTVPDCRFITFVRFSPDGKQLIIGGVHPRVTPFLACYEICSGRLLRRFSPFNKWGIVREGMFSAGGRFLTVLEKEGAFLRLEYDAVTWRLVTSVPFAPNLTEGPHLFFPNYESVAIGDFQKREIVIRDSRTGRLQRALKPFVEKLYCTSEDGRILVGANGDSWSGGVYTKFWETKTGRLLFEMPFVNVNAAAISSKESRVYLGRENGIQIIDTDTWKQIGFFGQRSLTPLRHGPGANDLILSKQGDRLLVRYEDGLITIWNTKNLTVSAVLATKIRGYPGQLHPFEFSPAGDLFPLASKNVVSLYALTTLQTV